MRKCFLVVLAFALCAAFVLPTMAQDQGSARGNLSGLVYDATHSVVPGAKVTITGPIGSLTQDTSEEGAFLFPTLIPGMYSVRVAKQGFKVAGVKFVEVQINRTSSIQVTLETGELTQTVEVSAASLTVDTSASSVNSNISDTFYQNIPVQRGVASLFYLAPGVANGLRTEGMGGQGQANPAISGSSGLENLYVADGVSINDPAFGGLGVWSRSYGPLGTGINLSFVQEVQVKTAGFEPQYGHVSGGIVQIVTKAGSTQFHGQLAGFFNTRGMQDTILNSDDPNFNTTTLFGRHIADARYEADAEMGGYVPLLGLKDKLFWFGTFNPTWDQQQWAPAVGSGLSDIYGGHLQYRTFTPDYAGKLTFKLNNSNTIESSVFGDPNSRNDAPSPNLLNADNTTVNSSWNYGTRNWSTRYDGAITPTWQIDGAFTWSWNHFTEIPDQNVTQITDNTQTAGLSGQRGTFTPLGFGFLEPYDSNTKAISADTSKTYRFGGQHTLSVGFIWQYAIYDDIIRESGPKFAIPEFNATGTDPGYDTRTNPTMVGKMTDIALVLQPLNNPDGSQVIPNSAGCTLCPYMSVPGYATSGNPNGMTQVALLGARGRFDGGTTASNGKYKGIYANDSWAMGTHVTLNAGLRWEQQRLTGNLAEHTFPGFWSPRFGIIVDPKGDRKTKIYANFGRYAFVLPLDAAVRELSSEQDTVNMYFAPASTTTGCPVGTPAGASCVVTNSDGTPNYAGFFSPTTAATGSTLLNQASGGIGTAAGAFVSGLEPFQPGVRMEYTDEFVVGAEHEFRGNIVASARYIDRRMKRVLEDEGGISVEQFNALAANGGGLNYFIGNPNAKADIFVNPNEKPFGGSGPCAGSSNGLTTNCTPLSAGFAAAFAADKTGNAAALEALGYPSACVDGNNNATPYTTLDISNTFGTILGNACFPAVNTGTWTDSTGALLPDCTSLAESKTGSCAAFGGEFYADGKPDTYKDPERIYQAVEFEVNKAFSRNWAMIANWRVARLTGNYEGAFRNDNNQADPGISSLFDLTEGMFGLIGQQQGIGPLNTDRKHIVNVNTYYVLDHSMLKGMVLGGGVTIQSGVPLTTLVAQQAYQNAGEVPLFGRGDLGRAPVTGSVNAHLEYPWKINDRFQLKFGVDLFNIADGRRQILNNENADQGFGVPNADFQKAYFQFFQPPFSSRGSITLLF